MARTSGTDHPRSRGVYPRRTRRFPLPQGSSPLARGLRGEWQDMRIEDGIIPARAGFTHGRSALDPWIMGSSPLARGLLGQAAGGHLAERIIPARAGFTAACRASAGSESDHPRSRGVYSYGSRGYGEEPGSSPLARGLPASPIRASVLLRIIPARAGFTSGRCPSSSARPDHPRSRGVYCPNDAGFGCDVGSSPLARGLRGGFWHTKVPDRIIPARAGFTRGDTIFLIRAWDHPRSRGVYLSTGLLSLTIYGSSPLARGLLISAVPLIGLEGIIPARAGFTSSRRS